jgi:Fucose 4-O-acetylase and related acetyltransferases
VQNPSHTGVAAPATGLKQVSASRRDWMDYARGIAIILIVFGHLIGGFAQIRHQGEALDLDWTFYKVCEIIYYARMPLFFVISGIYIRNSLLKRGFKKFCRYKFDTIFYPYLVWASIQILFQYIGYRMQVSNTPRQPADFLKLLYDPHSTDQFWFLYTLFAVAIVYAVMVYYLKVNKAILLTVAATAYIVFYFLPDAFFIFGIKYVAKFFFYLVLGDIASAWFLNPQHARKFSSVKILLVLLGAFVLIKLVMNRMHITEDENDFFSLQNLLLISSIFIGMALILNISFILQRYHLIRWLSVIGKNSLYIYSMHIILGGLLRTVLLKATNYQYPNFSLYVVVILSILLPIAIIKLFNRMGFWWLYNPTKPKNKGQVSI